MSAAQPESGDAHRPRVVVVDPDRRVSRSLAELLEVTRGVEIVGRAGGVRDALEIVERERPDVVVLDPRLPDVQDGSALISSIALRRPEVRIVLTGWSDAREQPSIAARATTWVSKSATPEEFVAAVVLACCAPPITGPSPVGLRPAPAPPVSASPPPPARHPDPSGRGR
ncbi:MAG: response regulator [Candidatus Limnocylindria bacterium]